MSHSSASPVPFDFVLFGGTGELALHRLLPVLFQLFRAGHFDGDSRVVAAAPEPLTLCDYRDRVQEAVRGSSSAHDPEQLRHFLNRVEYLQVDAGGDAGWTALAATLSHRCERLRLFYLATGPELFGALCMRLARHGLNTPGSRLVLEKPVGRNPVNAQFRSRAEVERAFDGTCVHRSEHYSGKE